VFPQAPTSPHTHSQQQPYLYQSVNQATQLCGCFALKDACGLEKLIWRFQRPARRLSPTSTRPSATSLP